MIFVVDAYQLGEIDRCAVDGQVSALLYTLIPADLSAYKYTFSEFSLELAVTSYRFSH